MQIFYSHIKQFQDLNNDSSKVENSITPKYLNWWRKVFLGHYHNQQKIGDNIYHLPSIRANNFGEDNDKGFTVLYDDGSHELVTSKFKEYHTVEINLDNVNKQDLNNLKQQGSELVKENNTNIRFKITGSEDKVQALNKEEFESLGITIQKEHKTVIKSIEKAEVGEVMVYDDNKIIEKFDEFCKIEDFEGVEYGRKCLIKKLSK